MGIDDQYWMEQALHLAEKAAINNEVPIGALIVKDNELLGVGHNCPIATNDPSAHAEIVAMRNAAELLENYRLTDTTLYTTLEPCPMCAGAIVHARIKRVVFAAYDPRQGAGGTIFQLLNSELLNHQVQITSGVMEAPAKALLQSFFKIRR